jgi:hypothetical protein
MDNEDFGRNNPPFQRYIPSCYGKYQRYIPSFYFTGKDTMPDKDNEQVTVRDSAVKVTGISTDRELAAVA